MADGFASVAAAPYAFPFDAAWSAADTAVLLLGFQDGIVDDLGAGSALAAAVTLAHAARKAGIAVIGSCREATTAARQGGRVSSLLGLARSDIVAHPGDNAFYATDLETRLRGNAVRNLLIAGLPTDGLVHATMRTANDMGFECLAVSDACRGTSPERHAAQLRITTFGNGLFGTVAPLAAVLAALA